MFNTEGDLSGIKTIAAKRFVYVVISKVKTT